MNVLLAAPALQRDHENIEVNLSHHWPQPSAWLVGANWVQHVRELRVSKLLCSHAAHLPAETQESGKPNCLAKAARQH